MLRRMAPRTGFKMLESNAECDRHPQITITTSDLSGNRGSNRNKIEVPEKQCGSGKRSQLQIPEQFVEIVRPNHGRSMSAYDLRYPKKTHRSYSNAGIEPRQKIITKVACSSTNIKETKEESTYAKVLNYLRKWRRCYNSKF